MSLAQRLAVEFERLDDIGPLVVKEDIGGRDQFCKVSASLSVLKSIVTDFLPRFSS